MPGLVMHVGATVNCAHTAPAQTVSSNSRVLAGGAQVATIADQTTVTGCPFVVGTKPQPCVVVQWSVPAARVTVNGQPALLSTSPGLCKSAEQIPQGLAIVGPTQTRVVAS